LCDFIVDKTTAPVLLALCVLWALRSNGYTWHNTDHLLSRSGQWCFFERVLLFIWFNMVRIVIQTKLDQMYMWQFMLKEIVFKQMTVFCATHFLCYFRLVAKISNTNTPKGNAHFFFITAECFCLFWWSSHIGYGLLTWCF
jgi:hypothetical protein